MTNSIGNLAALSGTDTTGQTTTAVSSTNDLANKEVFLQLLVAQIKNQNPLNPSDGIEFITQLAQFTDLEQTMGIRSDIGVIRDHFDNAANTGNGEQDSETTAPAV